MSKYNLQDLLEGMSDKEFADAQEKDRLENLATRRKPAFPKQGSYGGVRHSLSRGA